MARMQNGSLSVKSGSWLGHYATYTVNPDTGERPRRQHAKKLGRVKTMTRTQAKEALRRLIVSELGITGDAITVRGFIVQQWQPLREGTWRDSTAQTNKELLARITGRFGDLPLRKVTAAEMQLWLNDLAKKKSASVVKHCRIFLRSIFAHAAAERFIDRDPARLLKVPKVKTVLRPYLAVEEVQALLANAGTQRDLTLLRILFVTGMRPSELLALRWRDVNLSDGTITLSQTVYRGELRPFTKTTEEGEVQRLALPEQATQALTEWHAAHWEGAERDRHNEPDDYVFPAPSGGCWLKENYQRRVLTPIAERAEVTSKVNFQSIRRTVATWASSLGTLKDTQAIMRHRRAETTANNYVQAIDRTVRETVERLDATFTPPLFPAQGD